MYALPLGTPAQDRHKVESRHLIGYALENSVLLQQAGLFTSVMDLVCVYGNPLFHSMHSAQAVRIVPRKTHSVTIDKFAYLQDMLQAVCP